MTYANIKIERIENNENVNTSAISSKLIKPELKAITPILM